MSKQSNIPTDLVHPNTLTPHPENYNEHPDDQIAELQESHQTFGQFKNIVVWSPKKKMKLAGGQTLDPSQKYIIAGEGFWQAAIKNEASAIEVKDYTGIPYEDALLLMKVDNFAPTGSMPNADKLAALMEKTKQLTADRPRLEAMMQRARELAGAIDLEGVEFPEYDESVADEVAYLECPECEHRWPK